MTIHHCNVRALLPKDYRDMYDAAVRAGWTITRRGSGHIQWKPPKVEDGMVVSASTPGDRRAVLNVRSRLRRAGLQL